MVWVLGWCHGNRAFLTGFKVGIYWEMIKISKGVGKSKRGRIKYQGGELFFLFCQSKLLSHFVPVFPDPTLNERSLKLMTVFTLVALNARRILKYLTTDHVFQTLILLPSPCVNTV